MFELIFDLKRFDSSGGNDKTVASSAIWKDDWKTYSTKDRTALATAAYALLNTTAPNKYVANANAELIPVSGLVNNVIYGVDRNDLIKFNDLYLESFAALANLTASRRATAFIRVTDSVRKSCRFRRPIGTRTASGTTTSAVSAPTAFMTFCPSAARQKLSSTQAIWMTFIFTTWGLWRKWPYNRARKVSSDNNVENTKRSALNLTFSNGTSALVYYTANEDFPTRDYSPTFYLADGSAYAYNYATKDFVDTQSVLYQNEDGSVSYDTIVDPLTDEIIESTQPAGGKTDTTGTVDPKNPQVAQKRDSIERRRLRTFA